MATTLARADYHCGSAYGASAEIALKATVAATVQAGVGTGVAGKVAVAAAL